MPLDKIIDMQKRGMSDTEISRSLQQQGVMPSEINNGLNQARVKNAVLDSEGHDQEGFAQEMQQTSDVPQMSSQDIMSENASRTNQNFQPQGQADYQNYPEYQAPAPQDYYYQQTPQSYTGQEYYAQNQGVDTETISEIAEQVVIEKFSEFSKKTGDLVSFKNSIQEKVSDIDDRLKRIENAIDRLQGAIIGKIGEFGESTAAIHQDLDNLHGTVAKLMNPLVDNLQELKKLAEK